jgi:hypothetical protein
MNEMDPWSIVAFCAGLTLCLVLPFLVPWVRSWDLWDFGGADTDDTPDSDSGGDTSSSSGTDS